MIRIGHFRKVMGERGVELEGKKWFGFIAQFWEFMPTVKQVFVYSLQFYCNVFGLSKWSKSAILKKWRFSLSAVFHARLIQSNQLDAIDSWRWEYLYNLQILLDFIVSYL